MNNERNIQLSVHGMTCGSCVRHVANALRGVEGVRDVTVDMRVGQARVVGEDDLDGATLCAALTAAGYSAQVVQNTPPLG